MSCHCSCACPRIFHWAACPRSGAWGSASPSPSCAPAASSGPCAACMQSSPPPADDTFTAPVLPGIEASEVQEIEREFNADFLRNMLNRLDWDAFIAAATTVRWVFAQWRKAPNSHALSRCFLSCRARESLTTSHPPVLFVSDICTDSLGAPVTAKSAGGAASLSGGA
jgi:hypothetical protein